MSRHHLSIFVVLLLAESVQSAPVMHVTRTGFSAAVTGAGLTVQNLDFDSETAGTTYTSPSTIGAITFSNFGPPNLLVTDNFATTSGSNYLGMSSVGLSNQFSGGYNIDLSFPATNAIGFNIITGEIPNLSIFDNDIQLLAGGGTALLDVDSLEATIGGTDSVFFVGIVDTASTFTSAQIRYDAAAVGTITFNVDDVGVAVPEPSSVWMMALVTTFSGLALLNRKKQESHKPPTV